MLNILLLEDNSDLGLMLQQIMEWRGHQVRYARNGTEGLEQLLSMEPLPQLIICDMVMPDMDGSMFLKRIRSNPLWQTIPFIVMSANATADDHEDALKNGADGYLVKPFGMNDIDTLLDYWDKPT
jgi:two-component system, sensor histidine kinase and response regulator